MTAPATTRRAGPFNGNGVATSFPFTFKVFAASDIAVIKTSIAGLDTALALGSDYSITLNPDQDASPGGSITHPISGTPLAVGEKLTAVGALPYDQTADLPTGGNYRAVVVENALDRTVFQVQQLAEGLGRALTLPPSAATADTELPAPEAGKVIAWNSTGTALVNVDSADLASVVVAGTSYTNIFNGTGAQTAFALTTDPGSVNALDIAISGVSQVNGVDFTVSGTTLAFTSAPPAGTGNVVARYVAALGQDGSLAELASTASGKGAALVGLYDGRAPSYLKTVSDILNFEDISLLRFIPKSEHAAILAGTSTTDIAANWQEAIDALSTGGDTITGGTLKLHRGRWCISGKVSVRTGHASSLSSVNIIGDGMHNTQVYALPGFAGSSMLELLEPSYCKVEGLHLFGAYNAITGLAVLEGSEITIRDVFAQQNTGPGMVFTNNFMMALERLRVKTSTAGFQFNGPHSSINARNLYALDNSLAGFDIADMIYSHFDSCGSDTNREGYRVVTAKGLKFTACGAENNVRAGWHFEASAAANATSANCDNIGATLEECVSFGNNTGGAYSSSIYTSQADTAAIALHVDRFRELSGTATSILMANSTSNHIVRVDSDSVFLGAVSGAAAAGYRLATRRGTATYDPPSLADGAGATTTVTVAGVAFGDHCQASFSANLEGIAVTAWVSATDTVSVRFQNESAGVVDLGSGTLRVLVTPKD